MFKYKGKDPETGGILSKEFQNENEARDFADENDREYPNFEIYDEEEDEIVHSTEIEEDIKAVAMENMFPDEDSEEGFDWDGVGEED
jgi:hypothetical protein